MNSPVLSPDDIKKAYALKTRILYLIFIVVPMLVYAAYTIEKHDLIERAFPDKDGFTKNKVELDKLTSENRKLKTQIKTKDELIELYKKKASKITVDERSFTLTLPVLQPRFITWKAFQNGKQGVKFSTYREKQVEYLHSQLDEAKAFLDTMRTTIQ